MRTHTQVAVIGGGIAGCSALYHLTQEGITDCVLLERAELTSGTTWHSAAQVTNFGFSQTAIALKRHSIRLYKELSDEPDYPINYHHGTGGLRLATTQEQLDGFQYYISMAKGMGVDLEWVDAEECARRHPLLSPDGLIGAVWDPSDGDIDPAQLCQALVRRARRAGAEVSRFNPVVGLEQRPDGTWKVRTEKGDLHAEAIVNAGGYRANEVAAMYGMEHPIASMEHQYLVTEPIPGLQTLGPRVPILRCGTHDFYARQEKDGLLVGFYEQDCRVWGLDGIDPNFTNALCPDDLDRVTDVMEAACVRLPCLETAGIKSVVNGPITYTPDGPPLVGPIPGLRNAYACCGLRIGLGEGGGHGWLLAQIVARGEAIHDTWAMDPRRFTRHATVEYAALKAIEDYQAEMVLPLPHEHRPAGRRLRTTPLYGRLAALGARFMAVNGWERVDYYAPSPDFEETLGWGFTEAFDIVAREVETVRTSVGIAEVPGFGRFEIRGAGAHAWLDGLTCSRLPSRPGRVSLVYFVSPGGGILAEATVASLEEGRLWLCVPAAAEVLMADWLRARLPSDGSVSIVSLTESHTTLVISGPRTPQLLSRLSLRGQDVPDLRWLSTRPLRVGFVSAQALAVSFSGEVSVELHLPTVEAIAAHEAIQAAGEGLGLAPFGARAAEAMRIEKGYRGWRSDLTTECDMFESALERFVDLSKAFEGRDRLLARRDAGPRQRFVALVIETDRAPALAGTAILDREGRVIGSVSSGAYGHRIGENRALGFVAPWCAAEGTELA
ncbi:MAG: FAD-dependent oxidoreductase, partial [Pseudomonadota bacterium]